MSTRRERQRARRKRRTPWFDSAGEGLGTFVGLKFARLQHPYKRRHRRHRKHHAVSNVHSRYREKDMDSGLYLNRGISRAMLPFTKLGIERYYTKQGGVYKPSVTNPVTNGTNALSSSYHIKRCWDQVHPGPPYRMGGPLKTIEYVLPSSHIVGQGAYRNKPQLPSGNFVEYVGGFVDDGVWQGSDTYATLLNTAPPLNNSLAEYYTRAWDQTKPQIPQAAVAQFVYELRDLPGMIETSANAFHRQWKEFGGRVGIPYMQPREVADHFLNHSFGWVPLLSDISKMIDTFNRTSEHIARLVRQNGQDIRRMRVLEESESATHIGYASTARCIPSSEQISGTGTNFSNYCVQFQNPTGFTRGYTTYDSIVKNRVWAVGSFRYYRPEFDPSLFNDKYFGEFYRIQQLFTLYGARINPTLVYKLTPWSWLLDWFTNFGSYIQRLDDFVTDGITAKHLYVMRQQQKFLTKTCVLNFSSGSVTVNFQRRLTTKLREAADGPYGFNTPWNSLSPRQWAILGALGLSRRKTRFITRGA